MSSGGNYAKLLPNNPSKNLLQGLGSIQKECFAWTYLAIRADFLQFCSTHAYIIDSVGDTDAVSIRLCGQVLPNFPASWSSPYIVPK